MSVMYVYEDSNFRGTNGKFDRNLPNVGEFWNDRITSVKVVSGKWQLFSDTNYRGRSITLGRGEYANIAISPGGLDNDTISSVKVVS